MEKWLESLSDTGLKIFIAVSFLWLAACAAIGGLLLANEYKLTGVCCIMLGFLCGPAGCAISELESRHDPFLKYCDRLIEQNKKK